MLEFESENSLLDSKPFATTNNKETFLQDFLQKSRRNILSVLRRLVIYLAG